MSLCQIMPISAFMSTNLNSQIECYQRLGQRIMRTLGSPMISVEVHPDALYENISIAVELFTKYAGYTQEYIIFDSNLYEYNKGIRLDHLFTVANSNFTTAQTLQNYKIGPDPDFVVEIPEQLYVSLSAIPQSYFSSASSLSSSVPEEGITKFQIIDKSSYAELTAFNTELVDLFQASPQKSLTTQCTSQEDVESFNNMFDYDVMDYRKVMSVIDFEEGSSTGVNSLFTLEQTLAQQSYYAYSLGNYGFDLLSWQCAKDWIETREKVLAIKRDWNFDARTQYLRLFPQPKATKFFGIVSCYVERPIRDVIKEQWVYKYATALTKITWGRVLGKISSVQLLGGGTFNASEVLSEGIAERDSLESLLMDGASSGLGDCDPIGMFIG